MPDSFDDAMLADPQLGPILQNMSPQAQNAILAAMEAAVAAVPVDQRQQARRRAGVPRQRFKLWNNYYSIVRFQGTVSVVGAVTTITFTPKELRPFSYRIGDTLTVAGFSATVPLGAATEAETNLVKASETIAGEQLKVHGISIMPSDITDIGLWMDLTSNMSVAISMDGDSHRYRLGRPTMLPGSGGTFGSAATFTQGANTFSATPQGSAFANGWPSIENYYPFPKPLLWTASGETDSNFNVVLTLQRQRVFVETAIAAVPPSPGFTPPTGESQFGTFVDFMCRLHTEQTAPRSLNQ